MATVQCACGRGSYDNIRFEKCFRCSTEGKVRCSVCKRGFVDPTRFVVCYKCSQDGRLPVCTYCNDPNSPYVEYRNDSGTSLLCQSCYQTYGPIIVGQPSTLPGFGPSYAPDFGTRDPGQEFYSEPPAGFGFDDIAPAGFDIPENIESVEETVESDDNDDDVPQIWIPWEEEWVDASDYRMPDHHIVCYTREGKIPTDWRSRHLSEIRRDGETMEEFLNLIALFDEVDPATFIPMKCVCLNYDHTLCVNDGKTIFNGEAVCWDCINETPSEERKTTPEPDPVMAEIGNQDPIDRPWVDPPPF